MAAVTKRCFDGPCNPPSSKKPARHRHRRAAASPTSSSTARSTTPTPTPCRTHLRDQHRRRQARPGAVRPRRPGDRRLLRRRDRDAAAARGQGDRCRCSTTSRCSRDAAAADALDGRLLPVRLGPGAQRGRPGRGQRAGRARARSCSSRRCPRRSWPNPLPKLTAKQKQRPRASCSEHDQPIELRQLARLASAAPGRSEALVDKGLRPRKVGRVETRGQSRRSAERRRRTSTATPFTLNADQQQRLGAARAGACARAASSRSCCTASPAAARPRSTCGPSRRSSGRARKRSSWCRRSA